MTNVRKAFDLLIRNDPDLPLVLADPPLPVAHWLNPEFRYQPAATHGDSQTFAARQHERAQRSRR